jgi:hypothetical protein
MFDGGTSITRTLIYNKLNGGAFKKGETFNIAHVQTETALSITPKFYEVNITLYGTDGVLNRGRSASFSQVELKMFNASACMAELLAKALLSDGQTSAADSVTSSYVLKTDAELDGLLAWIDDGNSYSSYSTATDVTKAFTAIGGITRSDMFTSAPTFTGATTVAAAKGGINAYVDRNFATFSLNTVNAAWGEAHKSASNYVDTILVDQAGYNRFWNAIQPNQRYQDTELGKIGFRGFRFNGMADVVVEHHLPAQLMLGVNSNFLELYMSTDPKYQFGFTGFKEAQNSVDYAGQFLFSGNLYYPSPRSAFKLIGSALS